MKKLLIKYGLLHTINNANTAFEVAEFINDYDEIVLSDPNDFVGVDKATFFEILHMVNKKVWIYVPMSDSYTVGASLTPSQGFAATIMPKIDGIVSAFNNAGLISKLKGFFLDEFGYDYTIRVDDGGGVYRWLHINRMWQNEAVGYCHNLGYPVFVNCWFLNEIFETYITGRNWGQYMGITTVGNQSEFVSGGITTESLVGSGTWAKKDYVLVESSYGMQSDPRVINYPRILNEVAFLRKYKDRVNIACIQAFPYSSMGINLPDSNTYPDLRGTVNVPQTAKDFISKYLKIMNLLGFEIVGVADIDYASSSNIVYDPKEDFVYQGICDDVWMEIKNNQKYLYIKNKGVIYEFQV